MVGIKLLAVDPSLTCSGWALFNADSGGLLGVGSISTLGPEHPMPRRLSRLQQNILEMFKQARLGAGDILICEDATSMKDPQAVAKLERVRGIFETLARSLKVDVPGRIHPRTVQYELLGLRGKQVERETVKQAARSVALHLYGEPLRKINFETTEAQFRKAQDIIDALLVGSVSLTRLQEAKRLNITLEELFFATENKRAATPRAGVRL